MEIHQRESGSQGIFFTEENNKQAGELVYKVYGNTMLIEHTEVPAVLRGKGVGKQLVAAAVNFARKNKMKIVPACSFAKSVFSRVPEYQDVLEEDD
jgi:predicted GNAT family acetyltransferase